MPNPKKPTIAVDIDEVLFPFMPEFVAFHNELYSTNLSEKDFFTYEFEHVLGIPFPETIERVYAFIGRNHDHVEPINEAREAIKKLAVNYDFAVITARHPQFEEETNNWLHSRFPEFFRSSHFIGYAPVMKKPETKASICKKLNAIALIDDSIHHVSECAQEGVEGVLFGNYPWNQTDELVQGVTRCHDWQEVLEYFDGKDK